MAVEIFSKTKIPRNFEFSRSEKKEILVSTIFSI
jgi:hypothetical protein